MIAKYLGYTLILILALLVTFFGMGPVLFADGSMQERMITLGVVLLIYCILAAAFILLRKRFKNRAAK